MEVYAHQSHRFPALFALFLQQQQSLWTQHEIHLEQDMVDWPKLDTKTQTLLQKVLLFFAVADGVVTRNIQCNFADEFAECHETMCFYAVQTYIEVVHAMTYMRLVQAFALDRNSNVTDGIAQLTRALDAHPYICGKIIWMEKWMQRTHASLGERLVAFACAEGIFFSSSFCVIFYVKDRLHLMPGLVQSNEFIARDEALHMRFACTLLNTQGALRDANKPTELRIREIIQEAIQVELLFIDEIFSTGDLPDMPKTAMQQYVRYCAQTLFAMLEPAAKDPLYTDTNPFPFMRFSDVKGKSNFFERPTTEYEVAGTSVNDLFTSLDDF